MWFPAVDKASIPLGDDLVVVVIVAFASGASCRLHRKLPGEGVVCEAELGDEARHSTKSITGLSISFGEGVTLEDARVATRGITEQTLALGATVATDAVNGLKFSELLPPGVAERVVLTRLDRRADAVAVLDEPVTSAAE